MAGSMTGGCQCGRVRYTAQVADDDAYLCHCRMCQRATGGVSIAFKLMQAADVAWDTEPDRYRSSPFARRGYCRDCGTPLTYERDGADRLDRTVGSFDDPSAFRPTEHSGVESWHPAWLDTRGLPTSRTEDNAAIAAAWKDSLGHLPD